MINYETILSNYEDKLTLMQWLDKVEEALKDATATGFHVTKTGNATLTFSIDFDDGTTLTSESLVVNQGESVASAAIVNGVLELTLTNGDVLSAGNIFNGNVNITGDLSVSGDATITGDANVGGTMNAADVYTSSVISTGNVRGENLIATDEVITDTLNTSASEISAKKPVVEVMTGYEYVATTDNVDFTPIYIGACKNANKITFVIFGSVLGDNTGTQNPSIVKINIPSAVGNKLYPYTIGGRQRLYSQIIPLFNDVDSHVELVSDVVKVSSTQLAFDVRNITTLTNGTTYFLRIEVTFLLSENLAA